MYIVARYECKCRINFSENLSLSLPLSLSLSLSVLLNSVGFIGITSAINRAAKRSDAKERQEEEYFSNLDSRLGRRSLDNGR